MRALLAVLPLLAQGPEPTGAAAARDAVSHGRFREALEALQEEPDPLARARGRSDVYWYARDYPSCIRVAEDYDASGGEDVHLAWRAAGAAIWLRDAATAGAWTTRMELGIEAGSGVDPDAAPWWREQAEGYRRMVEDLERGAAERAAARRRARAVAVTVLVAAGLAFVGLAARPGREPRAVRAR